MTPTQPSSYLDQSGGDYLRSQLTAMQNGVYATMVSPDHTKAWDSDQLALQRKINDLAQQSNTSTDPKRLTGADNFEHLSLEQIRDLTNEIKPEMVQAVSEAWDKIGKGLGDLTSTLSTGLQGMLANHWQGQAAGSAAQAIGQFVNTSTTVGQGAEVVGMKVAFAQRGSDETFRMLGPMLEAAAPTGPPIQVPGLPALGPAAIPGASTSVIPMLAGTQNAAHQKEEARQAALQVLRNVYSPGIHGGDQGVPVLPSVQQAANPSGPITPGSITSGPTGPTGPGATKPGSSSPNSPTSANQQSGPGNGQPTGTTPAQDSGNQTTKPADYSAAQPDSSGLGNSTSTTPASVGPSTGSGGSPSLAGLGGAVPDGAGGGGFGGTGGGGTSRPGGPGSSVPGKPAPPASSAPGVASAGRAAGTAGTSPGMMGHGGGRGKSEDDNEHEIADYLHGQHLDEWIQDGQTVTAMPAFGAIGEEGTVWRRRPKARPSQGQPPEDPRPAPRPPEPPRSGTVQGEYR